MGQARGEGMSFKSGRVSEGTEMIDKQPKIMVVDDDPGMRFTLEAIMEDEGYDVTVVEDGHQAIQLAKETHFALIFMDIKMPGINGVDAYREIKMVSPGSVVVMMTGYSVPELIKEALEEGAYAVLYKPLTMEQVIDIMQAVLKTSFVLVVDDEVVHRETLRAILEESGHEVSEARDGSEAVSMVGEKHYDIVLMDMRMPGMDGFAACEEIRKIDPQVKIIFITGFMLQSPAREALMAGAFTVLAKPVDPESLLTLMKSITRPDKRQGVLNTLVGQHP
jgi:CheY-like chemotaxis protein